MNDQFSLSDVGYVYRVIVGNDIPEQQPDEKKAQKQLALLNLSLIHISEPTRRS